MDRLGLRADIVPVVACDIHLACGTRFRLINVYNAPRGCERESEAVHLLLTSARHLWPGPTLLVGDFNLHHEHWSQNRQVLPTPQSNQWAELGEEGSLVLVSSARISMHNRGGVLDLAWATTQLLQCRPASANVAVDLEARSDHRILRIHLLGGARAGHTKSPSAPSSLVNPFNSTD